MKMLMIIYNYASFMTKILGSVAGIGPSSIYDRFSLPIFRVL